MGLVMNTVQINEYCSWAMNNIIRFTLVCVHECGYVECVCVRVLVCVHTANSQCHNACARTTEKLNKQIHVHVVIT